MALKPQKALNSSIVSEDVNSDDKFGANSYGAKEIALNTVHDEHKSKKGKKSLLHNYSLLYYTGEGKKIKPYTDTEATARQTNKIRNASYSDLVANREGANLYNWSDFYFCDDYGDLPIDRMITLRRFPFPVVDNIYTNSKIKLYDTNGQETGEGNSLTPDIGRMVTYFSQNKNPLSEIASFSAGVNWKELKSDIQSIQSGGHTGMTDTLSKLVDPAMANQEAFQNPNARNIDPLHDQNKVYGDVDVIDMTTIRDRGVIYADDITLEFRYTMKAIGETNAKVAMLDLIGNALAVTTNNAKFWGGSRVWYGRKTSSFIGSITSLNSNNIDDFTQKAWNDLRNGWNALAKNGKELAKTIISNIATLKVGKFLDFMGRAEVFALNSLLTGDPTGAWHITIGNPFNPIMSKGNMIATNAEFIFGDVLGNDGFPTTFSVFVTLKSAMPRDRAGIETTFNAGAGRIYNSLREKTTEKLYKGTTGQGKRGIFTGAVSDAVDAIYPFGNFGTPQVNKSALATF